MRLHQYTVIKESLQEIKFRGTKTDCKKLAKKLNEIFKVNSYKVEKQNCKKWKLVCTFMTKIIYRNKIKWVADSKDSYAFYGPTKKECIQQAKAAFRYGNSYDQEWTIIDTD